MWNNGDINSFCMLLIFKLNHKTVVKCSVNHTKNTQLAKIWKRELKINSSDKLWHVWKNGKPNEGILRMKNDVFEIRTVILVNLLFEAQITFLMSKKNFKNNDHIFKKIIVQLCTAKHFSLTITETQKLRYELRLAKTHSAFSLPMVNNRSRKIWIF